MLLAIKPEKSKHFVENSLFLGDVQEPNRASVGIAIRADWWEARQFEGLVAATADRQERIPSSTIWKLLHSLAKAPAAVSNY